MLLYIVYGILFVNTVDMKIKACNAVHQSVWGGSFVNFPGLVNYKGDCRQDAQPIPNS